MYIRLKDKDGFCSPVLYVHSDSGEFLSEIYKWRDALIEWSQRLEWDGFPLGRLEPDVAMVDLLRVLTEYYVKTSPYAKGRIIGTLRILPQNAYTVNVIDIILTK